VGPGGGLVVGRAGFEASMEDADESVGELAPGGVVAGATGALPVVVGPGARRVVQRRERLGHQRVDEPVVVHEPGRDSLLLAGGAGDRAGPGVVLAGLRRGVALVVVTEFGEHPGAEDRA